MGCAYKNFWALNIDEAVAVGILRGKLNKNIAVFMPTSAQMPDVDLVAINLTSKRIATIQVKGSRAYEPKKIELRRYKHGSPGWFWLDVGKITKCKADYFLFLIHVLRQNSKNGRRDIEPHIILIKTNELIKRCKKHKKIKGNTWNFFIWVNPVSKKAFDYHPTADPNRLVFDDCLDEKGIEKLNAALGK